MNHFPFSAIVGLELAKRSLIYHAIDPRLGGTLLLGHRGCAKTTLARAFAAILPPNGNSAAAPFIEVPLGATDDRLLGSVDARGVLDEGKWQARSGLIEQAHNGVLYIDEINLLPDHLADFILDSAATGHYRMERDGLTKAIESRYILIGSMNPEEGELRPQLTDRFAHGVRIRDEYSADERVEIVKRRMRFDDDAVGFRAAFGEDEKTLQTRIHEARKRLGTIAISDAQRTAVAEKARRLQLEGVRAELAVLRTARASAAWEGWDAVTDAGIEEAWELCLGHRGKDSDLEPQPQSPPPRSPGSEANRQKSHPADATAQFPKEAHPQSRTIQPAQPKHHAALLDWWCAADGPQPRAQHSRQPAASTADAGKRISWIGSLIFSLRNGWKPAGGGWRLRYESVLRKPAAWIFVDASRSTGARRFLESVAESLCDVIGRVRSARFHLLVLQDGEARWKTRRATAKGIKAELNALDHAGGKSFLADAVTQLRRAVIRKGASTADRALICTDGLISPRDGETPAQAISALRESLRHLCLSGVRTGWLHPVMQRGMGSWVKRIGGKLPLTMIQMINE